MVLFNGPGCCLKWPLDLIERSWHKGPKIRAVRYDGGANMPSEIWTHIYCCSRSLEFHSSDWNFNLGFLQHSSPVEQYPYILPFFVRAIYYNFLWTTPSYFVDVHTAQPNRFLVTTSFFLLASLAKLLRFRSSPFVHLHSPFTIVQSTLLLQFASVSPFHSLSNFPFSNPQSLAPLPWLDLSLYTVQDVIPKAVWRHLCKNPRMRKTGIKKQQKSWAGNMPFGTARNCQPSTKLTAYLSLSVVLFWSNCSARARQKMSPYRKCCKLPALSPTRSITS